MLEVLLKLLDLLSICQCNHQNVETDKILSYCPDCGKLIRINWYVIKCSCCGKKRIGIQKGKRLVPISKFCTNCGTSNYFVEKLEEINYFNMSYAIAIKEEEKQILHKDFFETWVDEVDILKNISCLPQQLN